MATQYAAYPGGSRVPPGSRQVRPLRSVHQVKPGEDLGMIAGQYGTTPQALIRLNSHTLGGQGIVHPGMRLQI